MYVSVPQAVVAASAAASVVAISFAGAKVYEIKQRKRCFGEGLAALVDVFRVLQCISERLHGEDVTHRDLYEKHSACIR
jgi:hypothetical protein